MVAVSESPVAYPRRGRLRRAMRALGWTVLVFGVLLALLAGIVLLVNRRDEPPSDDARALEAVVASARPVAAADDAHAGLAALAPAPEWRPNDDPKARMAEVERMGDATRRARGERIDAALRACGTPAGQCAALLGAAEPDLAGWIAREQALLGAYRAVLPRRGWYEAPPPHVAPLGWQPTVPNRALEAQRLHLAQALLDARAGRIEAAREALEADARFWRRALAGSRTLLSKMFAVAALQNHFDMGAHIVARIPPGDVERAVPSAWRAPFDASERSLLPALAWEWAFGRAVLRDTHARASANLPARNDDRASSSPLFKVQATANRQAALMRRVAAANDVPHGELRKSLRQLRAEVDERSKWPFSLYNPAGRILEGIAAPAYVDYGKRVADLEGRRRALLAVTDLRRAAVPPSSVASALAASPWRDPYTGAAFDWNAAAGCVRVVLLDTHRGSACLHYGSMDDGQAQ